MYGIRDMHYRGTEYKGKSAIITLEPKERLHRCPECGSGMLVKNGTRTREFLGLPIGGKQTIFKCVVQRYKCKERGCGFDRQQEISFAHGSKAYIKCVVPYVVDMLNCKIPQKGVIYKDRGENFASALDF